MISETEPGRRSYDVQKGQKSESYLIAIKGNAAPSVKFDKVS